MSHTPEQRSAQALCNARKKNGERCRAFAGQGTDHPGYGTCRFHGGMTRNMRQKALREQAEEKAFRYGFGSTYEMEPVEALLWMVQLSAGQVHWLREQIEAIGPQPKSTESIVLHRLWNEERDRLARTSKAALDAGVAERAVVLAERIGAAMGAVLQRVLYDPELALTKGQQQVLPALLQRHLEGIERRPGEIAQNGR
jgi:hypothetical protein